MPRRTAGLLLLAVLVAATLMVPTAGDGALATASASPPGRGSPRADDGSRRRAPSATSAGDVRPPGDDGVARAGARPPQEPSPPGIPAGDGPFSAVGAGVCRTCHRALYRLWQDGPHARAATVLPDDARLDPGCEPCHQPLDAIDGGVGCEACHGPGSAYRSLAVMMDPLKSRLAGLREPVGRCDRCHNPGHPFHRERDLAAAAARIHAGARPAPRGSAGGVSGNAATWHPGGQDRTR